MIGAPGDDTIGTNAGVARAFALHPGDCDNDNVPDICQSLMPVTDFVNVLLGVTTDETSACLADLNHDGGADGGDIQEYVERLFDG